MLWFKSYTEYNFNTRYVKFHSIFFLLQKTMSTFRFWTRKVIPCDLCENPTRLFCNECQQNLCLNCVSQHVDNSLLHVIVPWKNRQLTSVFPRCSLHFGQRCKHQCLQCQTPVCCDCWFGPHQGHLTVDYCFFTASLLVDIRMTTITVKEYVRLFGVVCVGARDSYIFGDNNTIANINIKGQIKNRFPVKCRFWPGSIAVNKHGELIYVDCYNRIVKKLSKTKSKTLIRAPKDCIPNSVCCTRSNTILVFMSRYDRNMIYRYKGKKNTQCIEKNEDGNPIFKDGKGGLYVAENTNEDICVSDTNAELVNVLDKTGKVRFQYDGESAGRKYNFHPRCIVTDLMSRIIVIDTNSYSLHILDKDGVLQKCFNNCKLPNPCGMSLDRKSRLWVGLYDLKELKVIQYLKKT